MKILLCTLNYTPELTGIGKYSGEMAAWLAAGAWCSRGDGAAVLPGLEGGRRLFSYFLPP